MTIWGCLLSVVTAVLIYKSYLLSSLVTYSN